MPQFSKIQQAVLASLQCSVGLREMQFDFSSFDDSDWQQLLDESRIQTIDLLCYDATKGVEVPGSISTEWLVRAAHLFSSNLKIKTAQQNLVELLEKKLIDYVILKGLASASFYPIPDNRISGDIDFLVPNDKIEETIQLLCENGAVRKNEPNENHVVLKWQGVTLELHHSIAGIPQNKYGTVFKKWFKDVFKRSVTDNSLNFKRPCDSMHGAVLLLHTIHHITSKGLGIRQICDWACFVNSTRNDAFWKGELLPLLKSVGLLRFAFILTQACVECLGINKPDWLELEHKKTAEEIIIDVFQNGNFGKKANLKAGSQIMVVKDSKKATVFAKMKSMLNLLNATNRTFYPILNKLPWLYPFIMLWRILRYAVLVLGGKRESLHKASHYADDRSKLLKNFKLYQVD